MTGLIITQDSLYFHSRQNHSAESQSWENREILRYGFGVNELHDRTQRVSICPLVRRPFETRVVRVRNVRRARRRYSTAQPPAA